MCIRDSLYALWFLLYGAFALRIGAERFIEAVFPLSQPWPFVEMCIRDSFRDLLHLAALLPSVKCHCITCVAQDIRGMMI